MYMYFWTVILLFLMHTYTGPSPPRSLIVRVTSNSEVCATWTPPATPNGVITLYKLYAEIIDSSADITDAVDLPTGTAVKVRMCVYTCLQIQCSLHTCVCKPHPFCCPWSYVTHMSNNEEMVFNYPEVLVYRSFTRPRGALQRFPGKRHCPWEFEATWYQNQGKYLYQLCARPFEEEEEEEDEEIGILAISHNYNIVVVYLTTFKSVIMSRNTCRPCYVSKRAYRCCSEPLYLLRLNGRGANELMHAVYAVSMLCRINNSCACYLQTFPASSLSGCMELSHTEVIYHFQMSAVSVIQGELVEGTLSPIDARTTIYVPKPGTCSSMSPTIPFEPYIYG